MGNLKTSIILDLAGNLQARARQYGSSLVGMGRRGAAGMRLLNRGMTLAGRGLDRLGNRYTGFLTGAAGVGAVRQVGNLEDRLTRLGIQSNRGEKEIGRLKTAIFDVAKAPEIRVDPGRILSAVEEIIEKTGDLKFAEENIRNVGLAISATGAEGQSIGGIMAEFQKMGLSAKESFEALDILTVQGKAGAFTLQNLAALGPRVVTAYTAMGRSGVSAVREMGAVLQVIRQGTGSSEQAATSFEALMRVLGDAQKVKLLHAKGIKVFDAKELERGRRVLRPINKLMRELVERFNGDRTILQQALGDSEAVRAFNAAVSEFSRTGDLESLDKYYRMMADGGNITRDSARAAKSFSAPLRGLYIVWQKFADDQLTEPVKKLTEYLDSLKPGTVERWLKIGSAVAAIGAAAVIGSKLIKGGMGAYNFGKKAFGKKGVPGLAGSIAGMTGVVPVYVVNKHLSLLNDGTGFGAGDKSGPSGGHKTPGMKRLGWMSAAFRFGQAGMMAYGINEGMKPLGMDIGQIGRSYKDLDMAVGRILDVASGKRDWRTGELTDQDPGKDLARLIRAGNRDVAELDRNFSGKLDISIRNDGSVRVDRLTASDNFEIDTDCGPMMVSH